MTPRMAGFAFHEVTDRPGETGFQRPGAVPFTLTPRAFERHLDTLGRAPWAPVCVTSVDFESPGHHVLLTFDDGGRSALDAAEALNRRGWVGHFFIVTSRIGTRTFLSASDIRHLHRCGHLIGSHSHTHPDIFRELTPVAMAYEWRTSADMLSDLLGVACEAASVPGGEISRMTLECAAATGFRYVFTVEPDVHPRAVNGCRILGRYLVKVGTPAARVGRLAHFQGWSGAMAVRRLKAVARRSVPPLYRYVVARRTRES